MFDFDIEQKIVCNMTKTTKQKNHTPYAATSATLLMNK